MADRLKSIKLTQGKVALISDIDAARVAQRKWHAVRIGETYYAATAGSNNKRLYMHRFIMGAQSGDPEIDHKNGNGLDNRRSNLRFASQAEQNRNARPRRLGGHKKHSIYKGVTLSVVPRSHGKPGHHVYWKASVIDDSGKRHTKHCKTEREAALAYNRLAIRHYGKFARLNEVT